MPHPAMSKEFRNAPQPSDNPYIYNTFVIICVILLSGIITIFALGV
jgi:hypothetical protein